MSAEFKGKCLCFITGASRGFGQSVAKSLFMDDGILNEASPDSKVVLMARTLTGLQETKDLMVNASVIATKVSIDLQVTDMHKLNDVENAVTKILENLDKDFDFVIIFNNAGSLGDVRKTLIDYDDIAELAAHFNLNVVSATFIISRFCKYFEKSKCFVINTSSLAAIKTHRYAGLYTSAKACMDMFMRNLAADCPNIRTLNYSPGPMETTMTRYFKEFTGDASIKTWLTQAFIDGSMIKCADSVKKMMALIKKNEYESGAHIDFYDI